jgi:hypothetical protein
MRIASLTVAAATAALVLAAAAGPALSEPWFEVSSEGDVLNLFDEGSVQMLRDELGGPSLERTFVEIQASRPKQTRTDITWRVDCGTWRLKPHRLVVRDAAGRIKDDFVAAGASAEWRQAREDSIAEDLAIMACTDERLGHPRLAEPVAARVARFLAGGG